MESLQKITQFLNSYLKIHTVKESSWNGLQFEGAQQVKKIVFAVDAGAETFERAASENAEMIVVHHGQFWSQQNPSFTGSNKKRLDILYKNNISLYASHLPLDMHRTVGNNAILIKRIGARIKSDFAVYEGQNIGYTAVYKKPVFLSTIEKRLNSALHTECIVLPFGAKKISTVGAVSGSCSHSHIDEAIKLGLDLFITGESKDIYHVAKDASTNIIFAGHHASETVGVKALADLVKKKLKVKTTFVDIPTGL
jgi:dinuclear metal center YbgI/SA1388 family protein